MQRATSVDDYIEQRPQWAAALQKLRKILIATELEETVKWGAPCYTLDGKLIVGLGAFTAYVGLWFHQGAFLDDPDGVLINAQEGKTKGMRQWRFGSAREIPSRKVKSYVLEAIANHEQGRAIKPARNQPVLVPPELKSALSKQATARKAFATLTKGRQREYAEYISAAKQDKTKATRLTKILPMIEAGLGLNDKYRC